MSKDNTESCRPRLALEDVKGKYPGVWQTIDKQISHSRKYTAGWAKSCFIPVGMVFNMLESVRTDMHPALRREWLNCEAARIGALAAWRVTQGVYRFDEDIAASLIETPIECNFPFEILKRLPEWCIYIETPDLIVADIPIYGAWFHIDSNGVNRPDEFRIFVDTDYPMPILLEMNDGSIDSLIRKRIVFTDDGQKMDEESHNSCINVMVEIASKLLPLVLYVCSQSAEIGDGTKLPSNPKPTKIKHGELRHFPPNRVTTWDVGVRVGSAIRSARHSESQHGSGGLGGSLRPHIRRAHWHSSRIGPRKLSDGTIINAQARDLVVRWQPPIAVNVVDVADLPATIRPVH